MKKIYKILIFLAIMIPALIIAAFSLRPFFSNFYEKIKYGVEPVSYKGDVTKYGIAPVRNPDLTGRYGVMPVRRNLDK